MGVLTDAEKSKWQWRGRTEVIKTIALLVAVQNATMEVEMAQDTLPCK